MRGAVMSDLILEQIAKRAPLWPKLVVASGLALTAAWAILLSYGIVKLVTQAL